MQRKLINHIECAAVDVETLKKYMHRPDVGDMSTICSLCPNNEIGDTLATVCAGCESGIVWVPVLRAATIVMEMS